ncbi:MAG: glycerol-3-phosphate dehydrogenase subunit GlpB [Actinobacteria bacterium]|nr:MAG: glycerol-3-phosphate dehydrogenase subunit GlpB [Actinomycetota bacterium]
MTATRPQPLVGPASYDTVVIGAGLAGLTAALRLAEAGQRVAVLAKGVGATHIAPPTIDVLGYAGGPVGSPAQALPEFTAANPEHPYRQLSIDLLGDSLDWFKARLGDHGYRGGLDENFFVPTAIGVAKPTALLPETMAAGDLRRGGRFVFVGLRGLKDFFPAYLAENVARAPVPGDASVTTRVVELAPPLGEARDVSSAGFARRFERADFRESVLAALGRNLVPGELVGFPAVLGLGGAREVWRELEARLGHQVFEVPTLPPSVPGIRVWETMTSALRRQGARLVIGSTAAGAEMSNGRLEGVVAHNAGRPLTYRARSFVLATGGFPSAGLELDFSGQVREPVFDLPLAGLPGQNEPRFATDYFDEHALSRAGVAVDASRRPVNLEGAPVYENLYAAGATLAGAVPWREGSGNGLSLGSGYAAASAILEAA